MKTIFLLNLILSLISGYNDIPITGKEGNKITVVIGWNESEGKWAMYDQDKKKLFLFYKDYTVYSEGTAIVTKYDGQFFSGIKDGRWFYWYENGIINLEQNWKDGEMEGVTRLYADNGNLRVKGYHKKGKANGEWLVYDDSGDVIKKEMYTDNEITSTRFYKIIDEDLQRPKNIPKESRYSKEYNMWGYIDPNKKIDNYFNWYINGEKKVIGTCNKNGILDGKVISWFENGNTLFTGQYKNDNEDGEWNYWSEDGKFLRKEIFKKGKMISREIIGAPKIPNSLPLEKVEWDFKKKMWFIYNKETDITSWYYPDGREVKKEK